MDFLALFKRLRIWAKEFQASTDKVQWSCGKLGLLKNQIHIKGKRKNSAIVLGVLFLIVLLWKGPSLLVGDLKNKGPEKIKQIELEDDARRTLAQIVGGILAFGALVIAWRRVDVANETQITDRFTKAIEQLGNKDNLAIRLGGIYALARIRRDSKKDHRQIMEVLCAYVREECSIDFDPENSESEDTEDEQKEELPTDIQAILTILAEKVWEYEDPPRLNLSKTSLPNANLIRAHLPSANLLKADLRRANLFEANLSKAHLGLANLSNAYLNQANLSGANLYGINLTEVRLFEADLSGTNPVHANLKGAQFHGTILRETIFYGADLSETKGITVDQIREAKINKETILPEYLEITWTSDTEYEISEKSD